LGSAFHVNNFHGGDTMTQRSVLTAIFVLFICLFATGGSANRGKPNFGPALYGDDEIWGTKATTVLPAPNPHNRHSFDILYVITNSNNPQGQLPVAEAAPGNPDYNGGRWFTHTVEWTADGFTDQGIVPVLTSKDDIDYHVNLGHLIITPGSFPDGPPVYFECPLLPVKQD
jgi:hypothetical protein